MRDASLPSAGPLKKQCWRTVSEQRFVAPSHDVVGRAIGGRPTHHWRRTVRRGRGAFWREVYRHRPEASFDSCTGISPGSHRASVGDCTHPACERNASDNSRRSPLCCPRPNHMRTWLLAQLAPGQASRTDAPRAIARARKPLASATSTRPGARARGPLAQPLRKGGRRQPADDRPPVE